MKIIVVKSEGFALQATVLVAGHQLIVMDDYTRNSGPAPLGALLDGRLYAELTEPTSMRGTFVETDAPPSIQCVRGWEYEVVGELIAPTTLAIGDLQLHIDAFPGSLAGKMVSVFIERLQLESAG